MRCPTATAILSRYARDFLFQPTDPPPIPTDPPRPSHPRELDVGPFRLRFGSVSGPFGSVWLRSGSVSGLFRVRFRALGGVGVGSGRGPVNPYPLNQGGGSSRP